MIHKPIAITIGLALVLVAVISAVPVVQQKTYAVGSPGVGSSGGNGNNPRCFFLPAPSGGGGGFT
jgi:hypothetical protein